MENKLTEPARECLPLHRSLAGIHDAAGTKTPGIEIVHLLTLLVVDEDDIRLDGLGG